MSFPVSVKRVVVSGARPTGALHLGNYFGAIKNWVEIQNLNTNDECYFFVADWHALTTDYESSGSIAENTRQMVLDWLACGLDPAKSVIFRQSRVPEHAELALLLSMITPLGWLERNPTYKEQLRELSTREIQTHGFLGYPVLQSADILLYHGTHVPVGGDQLAHLELTREIARRFNHFYPKAALPEPQPLLTQAPKVLGPDNRKMSKSYGNSIAIGEPMDTLRTKVMSMYTDPKKVKATDRGDPHGCVVFSHHKLFSAHWKVREGQCSEGTIGCVACKKDLIEQMTPLVNSIRAKKEEYLAKGERWIDAILEDGEKKAKVKAEATMLAVRQAMGL